MNFTEKMTQILNKIKILIKDGDLNKASLYLKGMLEIAEKQYPEDLVLLLMTNHIQSDKEKWAKETYQYFNKITDLDINLTTNQIEVFFNEKKICSPIYPIVNYIDALPNIKHEYEKILISEWINKPNNYKMFQFYHCFISKKS